MTCIINVDEDCSIMNSLCEVLVNPVNCVGVMGAGLALKFKEKFPEMYKAYRKECLHKNVCIGKIHVYKLNTKKSLPKYIVNFPTKQHWKDKSKLEYIEKGMKSLCEFAVSHDIHKIALPHLGCGLGGLKWIGEVERIVSHTIFILPKRYEMTFNVYGKGGHHAKIK